MSNIRLKEVAAGAGVSVATASAALRGEPSVKAATRQRVEAVAEKLGYRKHSAASVLSSLRQRDHQKSAFMAWLTVFDSANEIRSKWKMFVAPAVAAAQRLGVRFEHHVATGFGEVDRLLCELDARGCDGIVLGDGFYPEIGSLPVHRFSVISIHEGWFARGMDVVRTDQFRSTLMLLRRVQASGARRIGVCMRRHEHMHPDDETRLGAAAYFQNYEVAAKDRLPDLCLPLNQPDAINRFDHWMERYRPEAVVGFNVQEYDYLRWLGYAVPGDVAYAALHVDALERGTLAGCQHNKELVSEYAVRVLYGKICHDIRSLSVHPQETVVVPPILAGASCPQLAGDTLKS